MKFSRNSSNLKLCPATRPNRVHKKESDNEHHALVRILFQGTEHHPKRSWRKECIVSRNWKSQMGHSFRQVLCNIRTWLTFIFQSFYLCMGLIPRQTPSTSWKRESIASQCVHPSTYSSWKTDELKAYVTCLSLKQESCDCDWPGLRTAPAPQSERRSTIPNHAAWELEKAGSVKQNRSVPSVKEWDGYPTGQTNVSQAHDWPSHPKYKNETFS